MNISAKRVVVTSFLVDILDVVLNITVTILTGSVIMLAAALEGLADLITTGLLLMGLRLSRRPPDKVHPFGYGREIYFWALISALIMISLTATLSFYFGWQRFLQPEGIKNLPLVYFVLAVAIVSNGYSFTLSLRRILRQRKLSQIWTIFLRTSLIETKTTFIKDLMGTSAAILGLIAILIYTVAGDFRFDGIGAMAIGTTLATLAVVLIVGIRDLIIGRSASFEVEEKIRQAAQGIQGVIQVLDLKTAHIGSEKLLVNLDVHIKDDLTTDQIEVLIDKIKAKIQNEVPTVTHIQIELETPGA